MPDDNGGTPVILNCPLCGGRTHYWIFPMVEGKPEMYDIPCNYCNGTGKIEYVIRGPDA